MQKPWVQKLCLQEWFTKERVLSLTCGWIGSVKSWKQQRRYSFTHILQLFIRVSILLARKVGVCTYNPNRTLGSWRPAWTSWVRKIKFKAKCLNLKGKSTGLLLNKRFPQLTHNLFHQKDRSAAGPKTLISIFHPSLPLLSYTNKTQQVKYNLNLPECLELLGSELKRP